MNAEQLKNNKIAVQFFRQLEPADHGTQWSMGGWGTKITRNPPGDTILPNACGTTACAGGHLALAGVIEGLCCAWGHPVGFGTQHLVIWAKKGERGCTWIALFGSEVYFHVFCMGAWTQVEGGPIPTCQITIEMVADKILEFIHQHEPGWDPDADPVKFAEGWEGRLRSNAVCEVRP